MGKEQEIEWAGAVSLRRGLAGGALWLRACFVNPLEEPSGFSRAWHRHEQSVSWPRVSGCPLGIQYQS